MGKRGYKTGTYKAKVFCCNMCGREYKSNFDRFICYKCEAKDRKESNSLFQKWCKEDFFKSLSYDIRKVNNEN